MDDCDMNEDVEALEGVLASDDDNSLLDVRLAEDGTSVDDDTEGSSGVKTAIGDAAGTDVRRDSVSE